MPKAEFDKQGKYFWHLVRRAGWNDERVTQLFIKRWQTTHWNALNAQQKRAAINMMRSYAEKSEKNKIKGMRQGIMALVSREGYDLDWLHERMEEWGFGSSMRALSYSQVIALRQTLNGCFVEQKSKETKR